MRIVNPSCFYNLETFKKITGCDLKLLQDTINDCYKTLDMIDNVLLSSGLSTIANLVELANLSSMVGNILGAGISNNSNGYYIRNRPHAYPDLLSNNQNCCNLELKMALETNKPKGHLAKSGYYIIFRYVLGDSNNIFQKGKQNRGDTVWIWEVRIGFLNESDFSLSNTIGDSGKTAVIKTEAYNNLALVFFDKFFSPYASNNINYRLF